MTASPNPAVVAIALLITTPLLLSANPLPTHSPRIPTAFWVYKRLDNLPRHGPTKAELELLDMSFKTPIKLHDTKALTDEIQRQLEKMKEELSNNSGLERTPSVLAIMIPVCGLALMWIAL